MTAAELIAALSECEPTAEIKIALPLRDGFETCAPLTQCETNYSSQHAHEAPKPDCIYLRFD